MKYKSLNMQNVKIKHIEAKNGLDEKGFIKNSDGQPQYNKNIILSDGVIKTRAGLFTDNSLLLDTSMCDGAAAYKYTATGIVVNINGESLELATARIEYDYSHHFIMVFGIDVNGAVRNLGYMIFNRVDDNTFYSPQNVVFYSGKNQSGGGIFAFVSLKNISGSGEEFRICEINSNYNGWQYVTSSYTPTVYINGRGNAYETLDWSFSSKPQRVECRNLLSSSFYAYYSTDGVSSSFRLPYTDIDNSSVVCRFYINRESYVEWIISGDKTSAVEKIENVEITANLNRKTGVIHFTCNTGEYSLPRIISYPENNVRILAKKTVLGGFEEVLSSKCSVPYGEKWLFSGGKGKNKLYSCDYNNPLYFPENVNNLIGSPDNKVKKLAVNGERIIALKESGVYEVSIKDGGDYNDTSLLADNGSVFKIRDTYNFKKIYGIGVGNEKTVVAYKNYTVWLGNDNGVYLLKNSGNPEKISDKAETLIKEFISLDEALGGIMDEYYILCSGRNAVIINTESGDSYYWEFPLDTAVFGIADFCGKPSFLLSYKNSTDCYAAVLKGDADVLIFGKYHLIKTETLPVESSFWVNCSDFGTLAKKKRIKFVDLQIFAEDECEVTVGEKERLVKFTFSKSELESEPYNTVRLITDLAGVRYAVIGISGKKSINFNAADIYYCE